MAVESAELAGALRQAKKKQMFFAFVAKGVDGALHVDKMKIPNKLVNEAKKECGGGVIYKGNCLFEGETCVFEIAKEPPATLAGQIKKIIKRDASLTLNVEVRASQALAQEGEGDEQQAEQEGAEPSIPDAPPLGPSPPAIKFAARLKALAPIMQRIDGIKNSHAKDAKLALSEAHTYFRATNYADANATLDIVEELLKEAFAANNASPPASNGATQQPIPDAARFAMRLKALAPIVLKAESTGSDFARQAKVKIGEANKLYVAKQYQEANAALDGAEALIKQAFAGLVSNDNSAFKAALADYQSRRAQTIGRLRELVTEVGAEPHPEASKAQIELRAVIARLTEAPTSSKQVAGLQKYLLQDDVVFDVCDLAYDFRTPMLKTLDLLKAALSR